MQNLSSGEVQNNEIGQIKLQKQKGERAEAEITKSS